MRTLCLAAILVGCGDTPAPDPVPEAEATRSRAAVPLTGGNIIASGSRAYASDIDGDRVVAFDPEEWEPAWDLELEANDQPGRLALTTDGLLHVVLRGAGAIATIDPTRPAILRRSPVCPAPRGLAAHEDEVWVACEDGAVVTLQSGTGAELGRFRSADDLSDLVVTDSRVTVVRFRAAEVLELDREGAVLSRLRPPTFQRDDIGDDGAIEGTTTFEPHVAWRMIAHPEGGVLVLHERLQRDPIDLDPRDGEDDTKPEPPRSPYGGRITGDPMGRICPNSILHSALTWFRPGELPHTSPILGPLVSVAVDTAILGDGTVAVAALTRSHGVDVFIYDSAMLQPTPVPCADGVIERPRHPARTGIAWSGTDLVGVSHAPFQVHNAHAPLRPAASADGVDPGWALFHMPTETDMACVGCHPLGREDGHVWSFLGQGRRRTQTLAMGGLTGTEPFHWAGDLATFEDLISEVYIRRMGGRIDTQHDLDSLRAWLDDLPPPPAAILPADTVARGEALFHSEVVGCAGCHSGARLTDNRSWDVGTGGVFQTPSLVGVASRTPLLHSGCAGTLEARFGACGGDAHGDTSGLSADEIAAMVAYLRTL